MSGFVAGVTKHTDSDLSVRLQAMSQKISHRGDRETTIAISGRCAAISRDRAQSGYNVDAHRNNAFGIVLDGLLANTDELRHEISAGPTTSPAEVVLLGYQRFGEAWFAKIDGCFALMIIDLSSGEAILVRDKFGHRPLYFVTINGSTWVGSEIKALLAAPGYQSSINSRLLHSSIAYGVTPGPQTLFTGVYKVVPGFVFRINSQGQFRTSDYYTPAFDPKIDMSMPEAKERILANLGSSVEHFVQECPNVGSTLSGGVDSALLTHLTAKYAENQVAAVGFGSDDWPADESAVARDTAAQIGVQFIRSFVPPDGDLLGPLRKVVAALEEPTRFENALAIEIMARDAAQICPAVMTGEGADFILGSREHAVSAKLTRFLRIPGVVRTILGKLPLEKSGIWQVRAIRNYLNWNSVRDYDQKTMMNCVDLVAGFDSPPHIDIVDMLANDLSDWPAEQQYTLITLRESAHCWIERMEKISAASGVEAFHPFETDNMLRLSLQMPAAQFNSGGVTKPAVRSLAADVFGDSFAYGEKKQLAAPMQLWLNQSAQLRQAVLDLKRPDSRVREYLDNSSLDRYLDIYERDGAQSESIAIPIFRMLSFEIWLEMFH